MKTYRLPWSNVEIDIEILEKGDGVIKRVSTIDFVDTILEMKISEWTLQKFEIGSFPLWLDMFIRDIGTALPETSDEFENIVEKHWKDWCTENIRVSNQLDHYQFGEDWMAHDMIEYYGKERADGSLFQRRYDFSVADIEVRIKSEQHA